MGVFITIVIALVVGVSICLVAVLKIHGMLKKKSEPPKEIEPPKANQDGVEGQ